ncbi:MAG TPA: sialidase family protein, partial [Candidatus Sulfotelmatobacter sp.]
TWQKKIGLPDVPRRLWVDPNSGAESRTLFLASEHAIAAISPEGLRTFPLPAAVSDISLGFGSGPQPTISIYATSEQGIYVSNDAGANWRKSDLPGAGAKVRAIATSLHHPETAYVSYEQLTIDGQTWMGVAKTTNSGADWKLLWKESDVAAKNVNDAWITERFGPGWGENPLNLTVAPQNANLAYGTDLGRTMRTADGGATWAAVYSRKVNDFGWTTRGLDVTTSYGVHFDPFDRKRQFITYTDIGLFRSEDGGVSWTSSTAGVPRDWMNTTYWVVFDPKVRGRMWSVNSYTHDLPRPKMWRHNSVLHYKGGACRSDDGGKHWIKSNAGMDETGASHILLDPTSPVDARVLYVAGFGRGVYKSSDGGRSWVLKNTGIAQEQPFAWRLARSSNGTLYAVIARRSEDGSIGNAGDGALYRSTDGAEHWQPVSLPEGTNGPNGLTIDPESPDRLYLAAWARATGEHGDGGGIFLSENGGRNWKQVLDKDRHIYDVTIDPQDPNVLYATGFESSAWRSPDRGLHWNRISGFNFKWGHRVIPDPLHHDEVYVTTFGGSVWHGAINGQLRDVDIATPVLNPGQ